MQEIQIGTNNEQVLCCPKCGGEFLRHFRTVVCEPSREDSDEGTEAVINSVGLTCAHRITKNPSPRRNGIRIFFSCENCGATPQLLLAQDKGNSLLWWAI